MIGRMGFPIFCYLLIEGFQHTRSVKKYAGRLLLFALVSEIPFDLGFAGTPFYREYQNVFFTLFMGLLVIWVMDNAVRVVENKVFRILLMTAAFVTGAVAAELLRTDYGAMGILCIAVIYLFSRNRRLQLIAGCIAFLWEAEALFAFIPIAFYNGRRGWKLKYIFYVFYPLHLFLIYLVCLAMGMKFPII